MSAFLLFGLVTLGALVSSLTGLGGGSLILAGLLLVYPPELALPLHSFTQLSANLLRSGLFFKKVNWKVVGFYGALMLPAAWMAGEIFDLINPSILKIVVGTFIIISILPWKFSGPKEPSSRTFLILGAFSGFLGVFVGGVGPMVTPFFNRLNIGRDGMIATKSSGQTLLQLSKIIAFSGAAGINFGLIKEQIYILLLASLVGVGISIPLSRKLSDQKFNLILNILLGLIALKVLYEGLTSLASH